MRKTSIRVNNELNTPGFYCTDCPQDKQTISMAFFKEIENMALICIYCREHDGEFPYTSDDGKFKFIPVKGKDFKWSLSERKRSLVNMDKVMDRLKDIIEKEQTK